MQPPTAITTIIPRLAPAAFLPCLAGAALAAETIPLNTLDLRFMHQDFGTAAVGKAASGKPVTLGGKVYERGIGSHANSSYWLALEGKGERFQATVGVDDHAGAAGSVVFKVSGDGRELWTSGVLRRGQPPQAVDVDLRGVKHLLLQTTDAGDGITDDHANWADARLVMASGAPRPIAGPFDEPALLTPKPGPAPRINGPTICGARPGNPFLYRIPCQGERPLKFTADGLPDTLRLDAATGIITGTTPPAGTYPIQLRARNSHGESQRLLRLVAGDTLALTPPMGWNHWYVHYDRITDRLMRQAADAMVASGMADVGYQYVNIDDCWMNAPTHKDPLRQGPLRDANGNLQPNKHFPDMKGLTNHIHARGLKAGLYTSPGRFTCAGFAGSYGFEEQDAKQFAAWGFDFLKYDWCSYNQIAAKGDPDVPEIPNWSKGGDRLPAMKFPYQLMGRLLRDQPRDMVLNHCQYGMGKVWEWGAEVGGHCWRTAGDLGFELNRVTEVAIANAAHRAWNGPGSWNDPDYIQIGLIGNARQMGEPRPCPLTPNEQYTYMSLWSLSAAPLFFSGDMNHLDEFTLNVLCNPEIIEVNQDALGQCGEVIALHDGAFLMLKDLEDGSKALGLFNRTAAPLAVTAPWPVLGLQGEWKVRDLWRQRDLGAAEGRFTAEVLPRGVVMVRLSR
ncbi:MAG: NPCBM/NEW2 domain-containing protein [Akkermansiaceae bacterium]|nr:NPCBM/NEW2 domain-containing protein [Akkermansiaceae bacterium]